MAHKRKRTALPRLTVLAWNKRELAAFLDAVERVNYAATAIGEQLDRLKAIASTPRARRKPVEAPAGDGKAVNP